MNQRGSPEVVGCAAVAKRAVSTLLATAVRLTMGFLRASRMTLHVGLGSSSLKNAIMMWSRRSRGSVYLAWMASISRSRKFSPRPSINDLFCASSSFSSIFPASSGASAASIAGKNERNSYIILSYTSQPINPSINPTFSHFPTMSSKGWVRLVIITTNHVTLHTLREL